MPFSPTGGGRPFVDRVWTALDGVVFRDSDVVSRPVVSDHHERFGRIAQTDDLRTRERRLRSFLHVTRLVHIAYPAKVHRVVSQGLRTPDPAIYVFAAHGLPGVMELPLRGGKTVRLGAEDAGRYIGGLPEVGELPEGHKIWLEVCWGDSAGDSSVPQLEDRPAPAVDDPLEVVSISQHVANVSRRVTSAPTMVSAFGDNLVALSDTPSGVVGRRVESVPEPLPDELDVLAGKAGWHPGSGEASAEVRYVTLRLVRALRLVFGADVEQDSSRYERLWQGISALETLRANDPGLRVFTPFQMDLWAHLAGSVAGQGPGEEGYLRVLDVAADRLRQDPQAPLMQTLPNPYIRHAHTQLMGAGDDLVRIVLRRPGTEPVTGHDRAQVFWAMAGATRFLHPMDAASTEQLGRTVLHMLPNEPWTPARDRHLSLLAARAITAKLNLADHFTLAALDLASRGAFSPAHALSDGQKVWGHNWSGMPLPPGGIDLETYRQVLPKPDGSTESRVARYPWTVHKTNAAVFWVDADRDGRIVLRLAGQPELSVSHEEFLALLDLAPGLRKLRLDVPVGLLITRIRRGAHVSPLWPAVAARTSRYVWAFPGILRPEPGNTSTAGGTVPSRLRLLALPDPDTGVPSRWARFSPPLLIRANPGGGGPSSAVSPSSSAAAPRRPATDVVGVFHQEAAIPAYRAPIPEGVRSFDDPARTMPSARQTLHYPTLTQINTDPSTHDAQPATVQGTPWPETELLPLPEAGSDGFGALYADPRWWLLGADYEQALGQVLAREDSVLHAARRAVGTLLTYLSDHLGPEAAASPFSVWYPNVASPDEIMAATREEDDLTVLLGAFREAAVGVLDHPERPSLRHLWLARPSLNTGGLSTAVPRVEPHDPDSHWYRDRHDRLGHRAEKGHASTVTWLLRAYAALPETDSGQLLELRTALFAQQLSEGGHSLAELLEAAQLAGVRDSGEPRPGDTGAVALYSWADAAFAPRARLASEPGLQHDFGNDPDLSDQLILPHQQLYRQHTAWLTPWITDDAAVPAAITALTGLVGDTWSAADVEALPWPSAAASRDRRSALRSWLLRHEGPDLLSNLTAAHVPALFLASGPDLSLIPRAELTSADAAIEFQRFLAQWAASLVGRGAPRRDYPLVLLRDTQLRSLARKAASVPAGTDRADRLRSLASQAETRAAGLADAARSEVLLLARMTQEALELLPPAGTVFRPGWATGEAGELAKSHAGTIHPSPAWYPYSTSLEVALRRALAQASPSERLAMVYEVRGSTARDVAPFARIPALRTALYPRQPRFQEISRELRHDASLDRAYIHVLLREIPDLDTDRDWDREILARSIVASDGTWSGLAAYTAQNWFERHRTLAALPTLDHFRYYDTTAQDWETERVPVPWNRGAIFFATASDSHLVRSGSPHGSRLITAEQAGAYLRRLLAGPRQDDVIVVVGAPAGAGPLARNVANFSGHPVIAATVTSAAYDRDATGEPPYGLRLSREPGQPRPRWLVHTLEAPADRSRDSRSPADLLFSLHADPRWAKTSRAWERVLGLALAADPAVLESARAALRALHQFQHRQTGDPARAAARLLPGTATRPDPLAALERFLDPASGVPLSRLMEAYAHGLVLTGAFAEAQPRQEDGNDQRDHRDRGLPLGHGPARIAQEALARHRRLPGTRPEDSLAFREAILGWLLPTGRHSLIEILTASHAEGFGDTAERAAVLGDAAHLYAWAERTLRPANRTGAPAHTTMRPPHQALYAIGAARIPVEATGTWPLPEGLAAVIRHSEQLLAAGHYAPEGLLDREQALLEHARRHGGSALDGLDEAHLTALYLLGGPDAALIDRNPVLPAAQAVLSGAVDTDTDLPVLLRELPEVRALTADTPHAPGLADAVTRSADLLRARVDQHTAAALEALALLPPVDTTVWWGSWLPGDPSASQEAADALPSVVTASRLHQVRLNPSAALQVLAGDVRHGHHAVLYEVERSSARDISPYSAKPAQGVAVHAAPVEFTVTARIPRTDPGTGLRHTLVRLAERPAPLPALLEQRSSTAHYPEPDYWNSPWTTLRTASAPEDIAIQEIHADGRLVGRASFSPAHWELRAPFYPGLRDSTHYIEWSRGPGSIRVARRRALPATGSAGTFFWTTHGSDDFKVATQDGMLAAATGETVGRVLGSGPRNAGFTSITVLACATDPTRGVDLPGAARRAQGIADATGLDVYANTGRVAVTPLHRQDGSTSAEIHLPENADGTPSGWLRVTPTERATRPPSAPRTNMSHPSHPPGRGRCPATPGRCPAGRSPVSPTPSASPSSMPAETGASTATSTRWPSPDTSPNSPRPAQ